MPEKLRHAEKNAENRGNKATKEAGLDEAKKKTRLQTLKRSAFVFLFGTLLLSIPLPAPTIVSAGGDVFRWNMDQELTELRNTFDWQQQTGCDAFDAEALLTPLDAQIEQLESLCPASAASRETAAQASRCIDESRDQIENLSATFFDAAARFAACPGDAAQLGGRYGRMRTAIKDASFVAREHGASFDKTTLYRALYGARLAFEEVLLQMAPDDMPVVVRGVDEESAMESVELHGVEVRSGDILVSRGGAPTSALIARGSDFPGNFSHIALVHVDDDRVETFEAHIERGVVVEDFDVYEAQTKLRVMLLRVRDSLLDDAQLANALHDMDATLAEHHAYDFENNPDDHEEMYCSEVAASVYEDVRPLWFYRTTMSDEGVARWLSHFGVRQMETLGPSDLEYDPSVVVVAEWRDPETLLRDHLDAAILDALLARAGEGEDLPAPIWKLAFARVLKAVSAVQVFFGKEGLIPENMTPTAALRVQSLRIWHGAALTSLETRVEDYTSAHGHPPPYWDLVELAAEAVEEARP